MNADAARLEPEPLLDLFGAPVSREERKTRRNRRRETAKFWAEREVRGRIPPEAVLEYYMHSALQAGDKEMAIRIAIAFLPYRLPRISAVMIAPQGANAPRLRIAWGDEHDGDQPSANFGADPAPALLAALVSEGDPPER
jgi:hypothetical protein